jgi:hypothetical protein
MIHNPEQYPVTAGGKISCQRCKANPLEQNRNALNQL